MLVINKFDDILLSPYPRCCSKWNACIFNLFFFLHTKLLPMIYILTVGTIFKNIPRRYEIVKIIFMKNINFYSAVTRKACFENSSKLYLYFYRRQQIKYTFEGKYLQKKCTIIIQ